MVRTKGDGGAARTVASKAPRKALGGGGGSAAAASRAIAGAAAGAFASPGGKYGGGNSYNAQPTPGWQKKLTNFFLWKITLLQMLHPVLILGKGRSKGRKLSRRSKSANLTQCWILLQMRAF